MKKSYRIVIKALIEPFRAQKTPVEASNWLHNLVREVPEGGVVQVGNAASQTSKAILYLPQLKEPKSAKARAQSCCKEVAGLLLYGSFGGRGMRGHFSQFPNFVLQWRFS